jgi:hypothetical protein
MLFEVRRKWRDRKHNDLRAVRTVPFWHRLC